jgi:uroporphyrinogen decarboxylase
MTSLERLNARLAGKPVDKIPNMNIYMGMVAKEAGASYREYVTDCRKLVEGNLIVAEKYGADSVSTISDPMREASAYGTKVVFPEDAVPYAEKNLIDDDFDLSAVRRFNPLDCERTADRIKGCALLREKTGGAFPVVGWIEGCIAEAADLRGLNELLLDLASDEEYLPDLFAIVFEQQKKFAAAQVEAGADWVGVGNAAASLIGPSLYEKYGLEYDRAMIEYIHGLPAPGGGFARVKLHICGNIAPLLPLLKQVAPDILDIDWMVDFGLAIETFRGTQTAVSGNINPVELLRGTPDSITKYIRHCIDIAAPNTLIAAGCEVPAATPPENLRIMDGLLYF